MTVPAGWFDQGDGTQRYWDGVAWTEHTAPSAPTVAPAAGQLAAAPIAAPIAHPSGYAALPAAAPAAASRKRVWPWVVGIVGGVLLLIIGLVVWGVVALLGKVTGPIDTVNKFEDAAVRGDCQAMVETVTTRLLELNGWDQCEVFLADVESFAPSSFNANSSSIVDGVATVTADVRFAGDTTAYVGTYTLIGHRDVWEVDAFSIDSAGS